MEYALKYVKQSNVTKRSMRFAVLMEENKLVQWITKLDSVFLFKEVSTLTFFTFTYTCTT